MSVYICQQTKCGARLVAQARLKERLSMSTKCLTCGDVFVCKCDKAAQDTVESAQHSLQQLQAKIAALTIRLETYVRDACLEDKEVFDIADKMRQLSAMQ